MCGGPGTINGMESMSSWLAPQVENMKNKNCIYIYICIDVYIFFLRQEHLII